MEHLNTEKIHTAILEPLAFSDYLEQTQQYLGHSYTQLKGSPDGIMLQANSPFEWRPKTNSQPRRGALLVHGLLDSPYSMRHIGQLLVQQGYLVRSVLLPGHGTTPQDLFSVNYHDWTTTVKYGVDSLAQDVDQILLVGFSAGATLCLQHQQHDKVNGLILLAPAIKLSSKIVPYILPLSKLRHISSKLAWYDQLQELDYAKYRSISFHLAYQAYRLSTLNKPLLTSEQCSCPMFVAISEDDETVSYLQTRKLFQRHQQAHNRMIIYSKHPIEHEHDPRILYRSSAYPEHNILDYSHVCIPIAPEDAHYGIDGDYQAVLHVPRHMDMNKLAKGDVHYGALSKHNLATYPLRRLTYNPDFDFLSSQLHDFIKRIER